MKTNVDSAAAIAMRFLQKTKNKVKREDRHCNCMLMAVYIATRTHLHCHVCGSSLARAIEITDAPCKTDWYEQKEVRNEVSRIQHRAFTVADIPTCLMMSWRDPVRIKNRVVFQ